jgi:hypothetical protein
MRQSLMREQGAAPCCNGVDAEDGVMALMADASSGFMATPLQGSKQQAASIGTSAIPINSSSSSLSTSQIRLSIYSSN